MNIYILRSFYVTRCSVGVFICIFAGAFDSVFRRHGRSFFGLALLGVAFGKVFGEVVPSVDTVTSPELSGVMSAEELSPDESLGSVSGFLVQATTEKSITVIRNIAVILVIIGKSPFLEFFIASFFLSII